MPVGLLFATVLLGLLSYHKARHIYIYIHYIHINGGIVPVIRILLPLQHVSLHQSRRQPKAALPNWRVMRPTGLLLVLDPGLGE